MPSQPMFPLYDKLLGGKLAEYLAGYREQGLSHERAASALCREHGVDVTGETIRRWLAAGYAEKDPAA